MASSVPPLPLIEISPAPPEEPQPEPHSPFTPMNSAFGFLSSDLSASDETYRPTLLTPPVQSWTLSPRRALSPRSPGGGRGLREEEFTALLRASKERSAAAGAKKHDLRKEVALKAHKTKQLERRALFLSKIGAPPSPTAISLPKTPPESPAIFHYSLPSPGLDSPLALFERLGHGDHYPAESYPRKVWVEQVDFRLPKQPGPGPGPEPVPAWVYQETPNIVVTTAEHPQRRGHTRKRSIPSLEEITERFSTSSPAVALTPARARAPLPAFLASRRQASPPLDIPEVKITSPEEPARPRLACTGRIRFPTRSPSPSPTSVSVSKPLPSLPAEAALPPTRLAHNPRQRTNALPSWPASPRSPSPPSLQITVTHVPWTESTSPVQLTEANLQALNSRAVTARDMLSTIRRRTVVMGASPSEWTGSRSGVWNGDVDNEKQRRRRSAPAEMRKAERKGFAHPVLAFPGGF